MLIREFLSMDPDVFKEEALLIILYSKSDVSMADNGKETKHTRHITGRVNFVINGENWKMNKVDWCEVGLQLADNATKNAGEHDLTPRIKYIMLILDN